MCLGAVDVEQLDAFYLMLKPSIRCSRWGDFLIKPLNSGGPSRASLGSNPEMLCRLSPHWRHLNTCTNSDEFRTLDLSCLFSFFFLFFLFLQFRLDHQQVCFSL